MVAFVDPRQSRIDITQAVGRAMRKPRGPTTKTVGYVVVPLFAGMTDKDSIEDAIKSERFDAVVDVLNALQEHDEELVDIVRELKERKGLGEPFNPRRLSEKIEVIGPRVDIDRLTTSISIEVADRIGNNWDEWFGLLQCFNARERHCRVVFDHMEQGRRLGYWVSSQRNAKEILSPDRKKRLDQMGFTWINKKKDWWEEGFRYLEIFKQREGHCRVPAGHKEDDYSLGQWVSRQRQIKDELSVERRERLDQIGFVWDLLVERWEDGFRNLQQYKQREGNCKVAAHHLEDGYPLGDWCRRQRSVRDITLSKERRKRLDEIGFIWARARHRFHC